jgi:transcriptional regulator with XRE-family HTH domain
VTELGACVRAWRERIGPADVGLPVGGRRRTTGLRREELAALAGVSVDYLVRLEQGRSVNPSRAVVASLARALRLTEPERDHLFRIAGHAPPTPHQVRDHLTPAVRHLLERLDAAVSVHDAAWTIVAWNPAWAALMGDPSGWSPRERNIIWRAFTGLPSRLVRTEEEVDAFKRSAVADLRAAFGRYPDDAQLAALVADLNRIEPFARLWSTAPVADHLSARKTVDHPEVGLLTLDCDMVMVPGSDLHVVVYTAAPDSVDAERFDLVRVIGLQRLSA